MSEPGIFDLRRKNLAAVIDALVAQQHFKTGKAVCEHFGLAVPQISQLLNSQRHIGDKTARELEQKLAIAAYSLDQKHIDLSEGILPRAKALSVFDMQIEQHELFRVKPSNVDLNQSQLIFQFKPTHYAVRILGGQYAPILKDHWLVIFDSAVAVRHLSTVCLIFVGGMKLILVWLKDNGQGHDFQSLDGHRCVIFQYADIESMHSLVCVLPPDVNT